MDDPNQKREPQLNPHSSLISFVGSREESQKIIEKQFTYEATLASLKLVVDIGKDLNVQ